MAIEWHKIEFIDGVTLIPSDTIYIIPEECGGCTIFYDDEYCIAPNIGVQEFVDKLKKYNSDVVWLTKGAVKGIIKNLIKDNNNV